MIKLQIEMAKFNMLNAPSSITYVMFYEIYYLDTVENIL